MVGSNIKNKKITNILLEEEKNWKEMHNKFYMSDGFFTARFKNFLNKNSISLSNKMVSGAETFKYLKIFMNLENVGKKKNLKMKMKKRLLLDQMLLLSYFNIIAHWYMIYV